MSGHSPRREGHTGGPGIRRKGRRGTGEATQALLDVFGAMVERTLWARGEIDASAVAPPPERAPICGALHATLDAAIPSSNGLLCLTVLCSGSTLPRGGWNVTSPFWPKKPATALSWSAGTIPANIPNTS